MAWNSSGSWPSGPERDCSTRASWMSERTVGANSRRSTWLSPDISSTLADLAGLGDGMPGRLWRPLGGPPAGPAVSLSAATATAAVGLGRPRVVDSAPPGHGLVRVA